MNDKIKEEETKGNEEEREKLGQKGREEREESEGIKRKEIKSVSKIITHILID